jgi:DNA repair photolyase
MPGINDAPHQVEPLLEQATMAGATSIGGVALHLRGEVRDVFMGWLRDQRPDLVGRYEELYRRGAYAPKEERRRLSRIARRGHPSEGFRSFGAAPERVLSDPPAPAVNPQASLF